MHFRDEIRNTSILVLVCEPKLIANFFSLLFFLLYLSTAIAVGAAPLQPSTDLARAEAAFKAVDNQSSDQPKVAFAMKMLKLCSSEIAKHPNNPDWYVERARAFLMLKPPDAWAAVKDANKAIDLKSDCAKAFHYRGLAFSASWREADAVKDWTKAARELKCAASALSLGANCADHHQYEQALQWLDLASQIEPENGYVHLIKGTCYEALLNDRKAIDEYNRALKLELKLPPNERTYELAWWYCCQARVYKFEDKFLEAKKDLTSAIDLDPKDGGKYAERAQVSEQLGNYKDAADDYTRAIALQPGEGNVLLPKRARAYTRTGQIDLAIKDCSRAIKLGNPSAETYERRAVLFTAKKDYPAAVADYDEAAKRELIGNHALSEKAKILDIMGKHTEANSLRRQIKMQQTDLAPARALGQPQF